MAMPLLINLDQPITPVMTSLGLHDLVSDFSNQEVSQEVIAPYHVFILESSMS